MHQYKVISFYKYVKIEDPEVLMKEHLSWCLENGLKGKVYLAKEGISGSIFGDDELTRKYKNYLKSYKIFEDIWFKETPTDSVAFSKMHVRVKEEIVNSGLRSTKLEHTAPKLTPEQLLKFYEDKKDFVIVDARNWYESKIGKFKNAITPQITHFREWPKVVESLAAYKDKTIVTYCTGGIRCEKASAYMREQGFKDVYQIDGGILNYILQFPDTYWEGGMFVFDDRRVFEPNTKDELKYTANCHFCGKPTSYHINCHNIDCDNIIVSCHDCKVEKEYCCSDECRTSKNKRKVYHG
ncbi:MAG: rhodanese-related sulfurtransferase [Ignavibacteriales bacterium]|nr:MAG: rhodanese-related sulfurtransferase [Ignavibacteriales bacterium]